MTVSSSPIDTNTKMWKSNRHLHRRLCCLVRGLFRPSQNARTARCYGTGSSQPFRWAHWSYLNYVIAASVGFGSASFINGKTTTVNHIPASVDQSRIRNSSTLPLSDVEPPKYCSDPAQLQSVVKQLKNILDNDTNYYTEVKSDLDAHSDTYFNTHHPTAKQRPTVVLFPRSTEDVSKIMKVCHDNIVPVIPYSGGTSLEGHYLATREGCSVLIDVSKYMGNIVELHKDDLDVVVQAGTPWEDLNEYLNDNGLLLGVDPGPGAQIGGCIGTSCSGTNAYRYGTMKENIVNITMVLPDGTVVKTKGRPRKSSAGYNLNGLFVGSEGTLGLITEATVKCHVKPKIEIVAVASFPTVGLAASCASNMTQEGIQLNAMELLDSDMMKLINKAENTFRSDWPEYPTMFFKISGKTQIIVDELIKEMEKIANINLCRHFEYASDPDEKKELWEARKVALWTAIDAGKSLNKNANVWTTDVAVPLSKFAEIIEATKKELKESNLLNIIVGHAGDGNFHSAIIYNNEEEHKICTEVVNNMIVRAIEAEGTCTGEHGVGIGKREYVLQELGNDPVDLMRRIKLAIDPNMIMNPDKIFQIDPNELIGH